VCARGVCARVRVYVRLYYVRVCLCVVMIDEIIGFYSYMEGHECRDIAK
jgi:hypothetical protein